MNCGMATFSTSSIRAHLYSISYVPPVQKGARTALQQPLDRSNSSPSSLMLSLVVAQIMRKTVVYLNQYNRPLTIRSISTHRRRICQTAYLLLPRTRPQKSIIQQSLANAPGDIKHIRKSISNRKRQIRLTDPLRRMTRHIMSDLVAQHRRQPVLAIADGQYAAEHKHLATGRRSATGQAPPHTVGSGRNSSIPWEHESIKLALIVDDVHLPLLIAQPGLGDQSIQHPLHHLHLRVPGWQHLVPEFLERLLVHLRRGAPLHGRGDAVEAAAAAYLCESLSAVTAFSTLMRGRMCVCVRERDREAYGNLLEVVDVERPRTHPCRTDARAERRTGLPEPVELLGPREALVLWPRTAIELSSPSLLYLSGHLGTRFGAEE